MFTDHSLAYLFVHGGETKHNIFITIDITQWMYKSNCLFITVSTIAINGYLQTCVYYRNPLYRI